jgi:acetoin utilization deacetylase AcuC-like enzyme
VKTQLIRPPGHHAGRDHGNGFCLINNIAVAVTALRDQRVCIIDFDGHHGDGTQGIFAENPNVLYCSVHQENTYPYSGKLEESKGKTARYVNLPVPVGSGDEALAAAIDCFLKKAREFGAEVIAASAGFDGHYNDRLLSLKYTEAGFYEAGRRISQSGMKNFAVLEGGYHHSLHECVLSYVAGINNEPQPRAAKPSLSEDSVREEVKRRIAFLSTADREPR